MKHTAALALLGLLSILGIASAEETQARGVNPADLDDRVDLIVKRVGVEGGGHINTLTLKYDKKLTNTVGLNVEFPVAMNISTPGLSSSGNGDVYARMRYITPAGRWMVGGSLEGVFPTAAKDPLGTGKYQVNVGALAVYPASQHFLAAFVVKRSTSVGGDSYRADIRSTEFRVLPIFILKHGWALTTEYRYTMSHVDLKPKTHFAELTLSKQLTHNWSVSTSLNRSYGDLPDRGGVSAAVKYFF